MAKGKKIVDRENKKLADQLKRNSNTENVCVNGKRNRIKKKLSIDFIEDDVFDDKKTAKKRKKNDNSENIAPNKTTKGKVVKEKSNAQAEARKIANQTCLKALEIDTSSMKDISNISHPFLVSKEFT